MSKHIFWRKQWQEWDAAKCPTAIDIDGKHVVTLAICPWWVDEKWIDGLRGHNVSATGLWGWLEAYIIQSAGYAILVYADKRNKILHRRIVDRIRVRDDGVIVGWFGAVICGIWVRICPFTMEVV